VLSRAPCTVANLSPSSRSSSSVPANGITTSNRRARHLRDYQHRTAARRLPVNERRAHRHLDCLVHDELLTTPAGRTAVPRRRTEFQNGWMAGSALIHGKPTCSRAMLIIPQVPRSPVDVVIPFAGTDEELRELGERWRPCRAPSTAPIRSSWCRTAAVMQPESRSVAFGLSPRRRSAPHTTPQQWSARGAAPGSCSSMPTSTGSPSSSMPTSTRAGRWDRGTRGPQCTTRRCRPDGARPSPSATPRGPADVRVQHARGGKTAIRATATA